MKPHPRIRKTIKWGGAVVTVLLVVVWIASGWWFARLTLSMDSVEFDVWRGSLRIAAMGIRSNSRWTFPQERPTNLLVAKLALNEPGIRVGAHSMGFDHRFVLTGHTNAIEVELPLWLLATVIGVATVKIGRAHV